MNRNFAEMLSALSDAGAEYKDLDIWVRPSPENAERVRRAIEAFGMPVENISVDDLSQPGLVLQFGFPPERIDIVISPTSPS